MGIKSLEKIVADSLNKIYDVGFGDGEKKYKKENKRLKTAIEEAGDIIHNIPILKDRAVDKEITKAWDILDKARIENNGKNKKEEKFNKNNEN